MYATASSRRVNLWKYIISVFKLPKKDSMWTLSQQWPFRLMLTRYFSKKILDRILSNDEALTLSSERRKITGFVLRPVQFHGPGRHNPTRLP